jgi:hypothetical protein
MAACTMITITKAAFAAPGGNPPHNARRTALSGQLNANRGPNEGHSDVILRLAKLEKKGKFA